MEKLPYREELDSAPAASSEPLAEREPGPNEWRTGTGACRLGRHASRAADQ
jgi:hypothetical protein